MNIKSDVLGTMLRVIVWLLVFALPSVAMAQDATEIPDGGLPRSESGQLLFVRDADVYVIDADGNNERNLTNSVEEELDAAWVNDGTEIVFARGASLYEMNADGSNLRSLTHQDLDNFTKIYLLASPVGDRVLWEMVFGKAHTLQFVVDATSGESQLLNEELRQPAWSPDGQSIAGVMGTNLSFTVVIDVDSGDTTLVVNDEYNPVVNPEWSPDGTHLGVIFGYMSHENDRLFTITSDGEDFTQLTEGNELIGYPAWSPDGATIAYIAGEIGNLSYRLTRIRLVNVENGDIEEILDGVSQIGIARLAWSPDSSKLSFLAYVAESKPILYVVDRDGSHLQQLSEDSDSFPTWRP